MGKLIEGVTAFKQLLSGKKTHLIAWLMVSISVVKFASGDMSFNEFISSPDVNLLLEGLGFSTLRASLAKITS